MREVRIVRGDGGGVHGDHVATPRGVCERDKARMNMIRGIKLGRVLGSNSLSQRRQAHMCRGDTSLLSRVFCFSALQLRATVFSLIKQSVPRKQVRNINKSATRSMR